MNNKENNLFDPSFLITIDTEGDNLWEKPTEIFTENAKYLLRFQDLCDKFDFKPTYLTNYEMALSPVFVEFGKEILSRNSAEIGMHLHAWNTPPIYPLTENDFKFHPYLIEYPSEVMVEKVKIMTHLLEDTFGAKMISHRSGRWALNEAYVKILIDFGYCVDCSVTPSIDWQRQLGDPYGAGGTDYRQFPHEAYFVDADNISQPGDSPLLEIPLTVLFFDRPFLNEVYSRFDKSSLVYRAVNKFFPRASWLRPNRENQNTLLRVAREGRSQNRKFIEFMLHSSEFMPGGSPTFPTENDIDALFDGLQLLFEYIKDHGYVGRTLDEHRQIHLLHHHSDARH